MTSYLVDTTTLVDFSKGIEPVTSRLLSLIENGEDVGTCVIIVAEFCSGLLLDERAAWMAFLETLVYWEIDVSVGAQAGYLRYDYARRGTQISLQDALIAATAPANDAVLITDNARHYPMTGLSLLSLRS